MKCTALQATNQERPVPVLDVSGQLLGFSTNPQPLSSGSDLLDSPFTMITSTFAGLPAADVDIQNGVLINNVILAGTVLPRAILTSPPANGRSNLAWTGTLPASACQLTIHYGLMDLPPTSGGSNPTYTGADFLVFINGQQVFDQAVQAGGATAGTVNLTPWSGQSVVIQLAVDADGTALTIRPCGPKSQSTDPDYVTESAPTDLWRARGGSNSRHSA